MPRKFQGRHRLEVLLSEEQYQVLLRKAEAEGYIIILNDGGDMSTEGSVAEWLRNHLLWTIPGFADAAELLPRGKYKRKQADEN